MRQPQLTASKPLALAGWLGLALVFVWSAPVWATDLDGAPALRAAIEDLSASFPTQYIQGHGTVYVADVYRGSGMQHVPRGAIKAIRVVEAPPKRHWTRPGHHWHVDTHQAPAMNFNCTNSKRILGDAPVEPDGSAYFEVPADKFLFFHDKP